LERRKRPNILAQTVSYAKEAGSMEFGRTLTGYFKQTTEPGSYFFAIKYAWIDRNVQKNDALCDSKKHFRYLGSNKKRLPGGSLLGAE